MRKVEQYIAKRKARNPKFAKDFESGYAMFELGARLKVARESAGLTQAAMARMLRTTRSAISRIENHVEDARLSTVQRHAQVLGLKLIAELRESDCGRLPGSGRRLFRKLAVAQSQAAAGKNGIVHRRMMASLRRRLRAR